MKKLTPRTYKKREELDNDDILKECAELISQNRCNNFKWELDYVLDSFRNFMFSSKYQGGYENLYGCYQDEIKATISNIKECVKLYLNGDIYLCFTKFNKRWDKMIGKVFDTSESIYELKPSEVFYKIRKSKDKLFSKKDLFHVPFSQRGKLENNRYSISGYPCLYLGRSLYTCWEETRRPDLIEISAVGFKVMKKLKLLDLRLYRNIDSMNRETLNMRLLPYILASSIRTHNDEDNFKPEYIIPQLLLHSVLRKNGEKERIYDGIVFTSTRRDMQYSDRGMELFDNVVVPVISTRSNSYCKKLAEYFTETAPVYLNYEILQGNIQNKSNSDGQIKYENTYFYSLEELIKSRDFGPIL